MSSNERFAPKSVLITGATGNLGVKLRRSLADHYQLRLLDREAHGDPEIIQADLSRWDPHWIAAFQGVDAVIHLAADPIAHHSWPDLVAPNLDAMANVFLATAQAGVKRLIYASSNHVMGGYQHRPEAGPITTELPPLPGTRYTAEGQPRDSTPYAAMKLCGERLGKSLSDAYGITVIAVRIGWVWKGENLPQDLPTERGSWFQLQWLSNRDFCQLMECCLTASLDRRFALINGMSQNRGMRWDLESARRLVGFCPVDEVAMD
jgi:uronate dehydrogenase